MSSAVVGPSRYREPLTAALLAVSATCVAISAYATVRAASGKPFFGSYRLLATLKGCSGCANADNATSSTSNQDLPAASSSTNEHLGSPGDVGLLQTDDLARVIQECQEIVGTISRDCRAENRKFRDIEFDIENDRDACLHTINSTTNWNPQDVQRISDLFEHPQLFVDEPDPNDIRQGALGDCWFLSAVSALAGMKGLVQQLCVAKDEKVGVYGFIFFKHGTWCHVIVDDLIYLQIPIWENLHWRERALFMNDRDAYNAQARKGGDNLFFATSAIAKNGETWVPLIEKAFAKLHGNYESLTGGYSAQALEDMTGGFSETWKIMDILDTDKFWEDEISKAGVDRFFDIHMLELTKGRNSDTGLGYTDGLVNNHAYPIIRAKEVKGKRFVVIRNTWGRTNFKWTGKWSDGAKEWTPDGSKESIEILEALGHKLGDFGTFVMEYSDFLKTWHIVQRVLLFDSTWRMKHKWLCISPKPDGYPWTFGEAIFYFTLSKPSPVHLRLSQIDRRGFEPVSGRLTFYLDFYVYKRGEKDPNNWIGMSGCCVPADRGVSCSFEMLEEGEYVVYPRIRRHFWAVRELGYYKQAIADKKWDQRKLSRTLTYKAKCLSLATNIHPDSFGSLLPPSYRTDTLASPNGIQAMEPPEMQAAPSSSPTPPNMEPTSQSTSNHDSQCNKHDPPPKHIRLFELPKDPEDREILVMGLNVYTKVGCLEGVRARVLVRPSRRGAYMPQGGWPVAAV